MYALPSVELLAQGLAQIPGIGQKTAERFALEVAAMAPAKRQAIVRAFEELENRLMACDECHTLAESSPCPLCRNTSRNRRQLCVVETFHDLVAIENAGVYEGLYHVLGGKVSPVAHCSPQDLFLQTLPQRIQELGVAEVIIAASHTPESRITMELVKRSVLSAKTNTQVTFFSSLLPVGAPLSICAVDILKKAFHARKNAIDDQLNAM